MTPARPDNFQKSPRGSAAIWLGGIWAALALIALSVQFIVGRPPDFTALTAETDTLTSYVRLIPRSHRILVPVKSGSLGIQNACFLWHCAKPEALSLLGDGDQLQVWRSGNTIWQLTYDGKPILSYADAVAASQRGAGMAHRIFLPLFGAGVILLLSGLFQRRRQRRD